MNERRFVKAVRDALRTSRIDLGKPIVAAVSGGADSMAMLESLRELSESGFLEVVAAHFNHGLRGADSDADERYVVDWCAARGIQCVTGRATGRTPSDSPEAVARIERYGFLSRVQTDMRASSVATGHTRDDQAETVLLHLVRGSGLTGLAGMRLVVRLRIGPEAKPVTVVRPLLGLGRADTEAFCAARGIDPRRDVTNQDLAIPRNRIRHQVLVPLRSINPSVAVAISRLATAAQDDVDLLTSQAEAAWRQVGGTVAGGTASASRAKFRKLHPSLKRRIVLRMYEAATGGAEDLALDHMEAMSVLAKGRPGTSLDLPGGARFGVGYHALTLRGPGVFVDTSCPFPDTVTTHTVSIPGAVDIGNGFIFRAETVKRASRPGRRTSKWTAYLRRSAIGSQVTVRSRQRGDRFMPSGMTEEKKLQDFFVDEKVPREWRDRVPLVTADQGIVWVVGFRVAEWARAKTAGIAVRLVVKPP